MSVQASQYGDELRIVKGEVAEVNRLISRLQSEIEAVKAQVQLQATLSRVESNFLNSFRFSMNDFFVPEPVQRGGLENQLAEAEERGELAVKEAKARTRDLEDALQRAKQDMARQLREYQVNEREVWVEKKRWVVTETRKEQNQGSRFSFTVIIQYRTVQV